MNDLLKNQRITKRKYSGVTAPGPKAKALGKTRLKPAFRPDRILNLSEQNSRFIEKVKQDPSVLSRRQSHRQIKSKLKENRASFSLFKESSGEEKSRYSSLIVPAFTVVGLFMVVVGIFYIISSQGGSLDWTGRNVVNSGGDQSVHYNLAIYAGLNSQESRRLEGAEDGEAIPLDLTETFEWKSYKVQKGDSVSKIAAAFSISMDAIIASNGITNARVLREGEVLKIPNMDGIPYTVKKGDSLSGISKSMGVPLEAILDANDIRSDVINAGMTLFIPGARMNREDLRLALGELFIHPVRGARLSSPFGWRNDPISGVRRHHAAIDLSAPQGTTVIAAMEGKVLALGFNGTYGNFIILSHPGNYQTMYAHLHTTAVSRNDSVSQGATIGTVGNTGYSTGPHLHFAVYRNSRPVNPLDYISSRR